MTAVLIGDFTPNSPEWHEARTQGIGASEIAAVVGLSPFESAFSLWHRKKGNLPGADPANPLFYWGHALEPVVAQKFSEVHSRQGYKVEQVGTYASSERPWQIANVDRLVNIGGDHVAGLEIKTTRYPDNWGADGSDEIPVHVRCQVMQQMDVLNLPFTWVAVLIGGNDYREYRIGFDEDDAAALRTAGAAFWESLQTDDEPPIDASFETFQAVKDLHPDIDGSDAELDPDLWAAYVITKSDADAATSKHRAIKSSVLQEIGDARRALVHGSPVLRRQPGRNGSVSLYPVKESA